MVRGVCGWCSGTPCLSVGWPRLIGGRVARMMAGDVDVSRACSEAGLPFEGLASDGSFEGVERLTASLNSFTCFGGTPPSFCGGTFVSLTVPAGPTDISFAFLCHPSLQVQKAPKATWKFPRLLHADAGALTVATKCNGACDENHKKDDCLGLERSLNRGSTTCDEDVRVPLRAEKGRRPHVLPRSSGAGRSSPRKNRVRQCSIRGTSLPETVLGWEGFIVRYG